MAPPQATLVAADPTPNSADDFGLSGQEGDVRVTLQIAPDFTGPLPVQLGPLFKPFVPAEGSAGYVLTQVSP